MREENFVVALRKKFRFFKNRARKVLPKSSQGIAETSLESGSGVFARDSEVERESCI